MGGLWSVQSDVVSSAQSQHVSTPECRLSPGTAGHGSDYRQGLLQQDRPGEGRAENQGGDSV